MSMEDMLGDPVELRNDLTKRYKYIGKRTHGPDESCFCAEDQMEMRMLAMLLLDTDPAFKEQKEPA